MERARQRERERERERDRERERERAHDTPIQHISSINRHTGSLAAWAAQSRFQLNTPPTRETRGPVEIVCMRIACPELDVLPSLLYHKDNTGPGTLKVQHLGNVGEMDASNSIISKSIALCIIHYALSVYSIVPWKCRRDGCSEQHYVQRANVQASAACR